MRKIGVGRFQLCHNKINVISTKSLQYDPLSLIVNFLQSSLHAPLETMGPFSVSPEKHMLPPKLSEFPLCDNWFLNRQEKKACSAALQQVILLRFKKMTVDAAIQAKSQKELARFASSSWEKFRGNFCPYIRPESQKDPPCLITCIGYVS